MRIYLQIYLKINLLTYLQVLLQIYLQIYLFRNYSSARGHGMGVGVGAMVVGSQTTEGREAAGAACRYVHIEPEADARDRPIGEA